MPRRRRPEVPAPQTAPAELPASPPGHGAPQERLVVVAAKVPREVREGLDAMAARLRTPTPSELPNRSIAVRASYDIAETVLRGDRLRLLNELGGASLTEAVDRVMEAGLRAIAKAP